MAGIRCWSCKNYEGWKKRREKSAKIEKFIYGGDEIEDKLEGKIN